MACMSHHRRSVLLVQLPIPPLGPAPIRGNVPLAAAYLKLFARHRGLEPFFDIDILPARQANALGDRALVAAIAERAPWLVGFTCYLWNVERVLWIAGELKRRCPNVRIVLGGPEVTADNAWLLETPDYDFAVIGEGEQTFAQLLLGLLGDDLPPLPIPGLFLPNPGSGPRYHPSHRPERREPLPDLNVLGSPYLAGILDAADEEMLLLETARGCRYRCRFCYYWKSYDAVYQLSDDSIRASLRHAAERGACEVFLLDPTLNQRRDFAALLRLLAEGNPGHRFTYFGELRGEGVTEETARLLRAANFTEVEVGLQSVEPDAMALMDRKNNLRAFERGVRALLGQGIKVRVDLIVGLPGDTPESVRRGLRYLHDGGLYSDLQVFNLAVLPGTAFREDAATLGLKYQPRPPYYVLQTPTLRREDLFGLIREAQELFGVEFDAPPRPVLDFPAGPAEAVWRIDLDRDSRSAPPTAERRAQAFTLWLRSAHFGAWRREASALVRAVLADNPFTTLQVVLDPATDDPGAVMNDLSAVLLGGLLAVCQETPTYLDKFFALQPGSLNGAKRLVVVLPAALRGRLDPDWIEEIGSVATLAWRGADEAAERDMEAHEFAWVS
jgi:radical SAM superfamily enzyme YgiQ (UPF0313 family)